jgi:hypothetical protein
LLADKDPSVGSNIESSWVRQPADLSFREAAW